MTLMKSLVAIFHINQLHLIKWERFLIYILTLAILSKNHKEQLSQNAQYAVLDEFPINFALFYSVLSFVW